MTSNKRQSTRNPCVQSSDPMLATSLTKMSLALSLLFLSGQSVTALMTSPLSRPSAFFSSSSKSHPGKINNNNNIFATRSFSFLETSNNYFGMRQFAGHLHLSQSNQQGDDDEEEDASFFLQASKTAAKERLDLLKEGKDPLEEIVASSSPSPTTTTTVTVPPLKSEEVPSPIENNDNANDDQSEETETATSNETGANNSEEEAKNEEIPIQAGEPDEETNATPDVALGDDNYADLLSSISASPLAQSLETATFDDSAPSEAADDTSVKKSSDAQSYNFQRKLLETRLSLEKRAKQSMSTAGEEDHDVTTVSIDDKALQADANSEPEQTDTTPAEDADDGDDADSSTKQSLIVTGMTASEPEPEDDTFFVEASRQAAQTRFELMKEGRDTLMAGFSSSSTDKEEKVEAEEKSDEKEMEQEVADVDVESEAEAVEVSKPTDLDEGADESVDSSTIEVGEANIAPETPAEDEVVDDQPSEDTPVSSTQPEQSSDDEINPEKVGMGLLILTQSMLALKQIVDKK